MEEIIIENFKVTEMKIASSAHRVILSALQNAAN
jgi:hypothetical protein